MVASCGCCWIHDLPVCLWSHLGLSSGSPLAICTVGNQDNKCLQDPPGQSAVYPANVLHHHEPPESGQRGLRPRSRWLRACFGICVDKGGPLAVINEKSLFGISEQAGAGLPTLQGPRLFQSQAPCYPERKSLMWGFVLSRSYGFQKKE